MLNENGVFGANCMVSAMYLCSHLLSAAMSQMDSFGHGSHLAMRCTVSSVYSAVHSSVTGSVLLYSVIDPFYMRNSCFDRCLLLSEHQERSDRFPIAFGNGHLLSVICSHQKNHVSILFTYYFNQSCSLPHFFEYMGFRKIMHAFIKTYIEIITRQYYHRVSNKPVSENHSHEVLVSMSASL